MELCTLTSADRDAVIDCFHRAFADYIVELKLSRDELIFMMDRRGADLECSVGAFEGDTMVAVMVVAVDAFEGVPSAYDVFTGVDPVARGQSLARRMFETALPAVRRRNAERFVLEVVTENAAAVHSYVKAGFAERRLLRVFAFDTIEPNDLTVDEISVDEAFATRPPLCARPSWQNSDASIRRSGDEIVALRVHGGDRTLGVAFDCPRSRDVPQIHVVDGRPDVLQALLAEARERNLGDGPLRVINVDGGAKEFGDALALLADDEYLSQFEMVLPIDPSITTPSD